MAYLIGGMVGLIVGMVVGVVAGIKAGRSSKAETQRPLSNEELAQQERIRAGQSL